MSEYESLQQDIAGVAESLAHYAQAVGRAVGAHDLEIRKLWEDREALRDELHALANRVETLTRARLTEPAEVAEAVVSRSRWQACSECGDAIRRSASDGLIYDQDGLHTCKASA